MARLSRTLALVVAVLVIAGGFAAQVDPRPAVAKGRPDGTVPEQYIVRLRDGVDPGSKLISVERGGGVSRRHVYRHAFNGFAARLSDERLAELRADPDVLSIVQDYAISIAAETMPSGIKRSEANVNAHTQIDRNPVGVEVDAGVAIVDSGIDLDHPDLNVAGGVNCATDGTSPDDLNGHGTHVAGTVGAMDNDINVVGVAPGARLYAVRVLDAAGSGEFSNAICGLDWILEHAGEIDVVNMSFGGEAPEGSCSDGSLHQAICEVIAAGMTVVVAAGNGGSDSVGDDAADLAPASFDEVITVSAIVDMDGKPGGGGFGHFLWGPEDSLAHFSNRGADVDIAAPGVSILSTWPSGQNYSDGTSMAAPHVAGAAAIVRAMNPGLSPLDVRNAILAVAWPQGSPQGFSGDTDGFAEPLLNVGALGGDPLPPPPATCSMTPLEGTVGASVRVSCAAFDPREFVHIYWDVTTGGFRGGIFTDAAGSGSATLTIPSSPAGEHAVIIKGATSGKIVSIPFVVGPSLTMNSSTVTSGGYAMLSLKGFGSGEQVRVGWVNQTGTVDLATATAGADGSVNVFVRVPKTPRGTYTVTAIGQTTGVSASTALTVVASMSPAIMSARVGSSITLTLAGYMANENVAFTWSDGDVTRSLGSVTTSTDGSATHKIVVPESYKGAHALTAVGDQGTTISGTVNVLSSMSLPSFYAQVDGTMTVKLSGFAANEEVVINWYHTNTIFQQVAVVTVDANGGGTFSFIVPETTQGMHKIQAISGSSGPYVMASAYVQPSIVVTPISGSSGSEVTALVKGYRANETVTIRWYQTAWSYTALASATASDTGSASVWFTVPANQTLGSHKVVSVGSSSFAQATTSFTVN